MKLDKSSKVLETAHAEVRDNWIARKLFIYPLYYISSSGLLRSDCCMLEYSTCKETLEKRWCNRRIGSLSYLTALVRSAFFWAPRAPPARKKVKVKVSMGTCRARSPQTDCPPPNPLSCYRRLSRSCLPFKSKSPSLQTLFDFPPHPLREPD
ncbi:hypothetical protein K440DRAFT_318889 [Wilcoxina mikolae CBS 423.85]|nr:hypothetical protein K440DRAFT_318889 [Wilcoxina mikolae CBS 423.85]